MSRKLLNLCLAALLSVVSTAAWALSEVNGVYQIGTAEDLIAFAELVNGENPYADAVLTADIDKGMDATMIGRDGQDFQGTFDGQGHTITINMFDYYAIRDGNDVLDEEANRYYHASGNVGNNNQYNISFLVLLNLYFLISILISVLNFLT